MSWVKLDDSFRFHPKAVLAKALGRDLYVSALGWSKHHLTDGRIPAAIVPTLVDPEDVRKVPDLCIRLVALRLWELDEAPGSDGYVIHDYASHGNLTRAEVEAEREAAKVRQRKARGGASQRSTDPPVTDLSQRDAPEVPRDPRARPRPRPGSETETETESKKDKSESTHTAAALVEVFPDLAEDVDGLLSELTDAFPGLDYVQLAKEGRVWKRANKASHHTGASLLRKWCADAWAKRQAVKSRAEETVALIGQSKPDYHRPFTERTAKETEDRAQESLRLAAAAAEARKREMGT